MREYDNMIRGEIYSSFDPELQQMRQRAHALCRKYDQLAEDDPERRAVLAELFPDAAEPVFQGEIFVDYGCNLHIGSNFYANNRFTAQ